MSVTQIRPPREKQERAVPKIDQVEMKGRVNDILNRWPAVGLALGIVRNGRLEFFDGHGFADVASQTPITEDTIFRIGSITKTFTAIAVMQLWEQGLVDLDAPANDYLRAYKLVPAKASCRAATVGHLLTHTAGIREVLHPSPGFWLLDEFVKAGQPVPSLAEYYRGGLPIQTEPGTRFRYTDHGSATLGQIVEDVSGRPLDLYLRDHVFEPLGMTCTDLLRSERVRSHLAKGYNVGSRGAKAIADYEVVTVGGGAAYSTPRDMARYTAALLGDGANEHGSVLRPATLRTMFEPHYQPDPRIPGEGLVFSRTILGGHLVVWHGGIVPGFISQMWLAPGAAVGVIAFTNGSRRGMLWLPTEVSRLLGAPDDAVRVDVPHHPEIWGDICGWYRLPARLTDVRVRAMMGLGAEVFVRRGQPTVRILSPLPAAYRGFTLHPDDDNDPYVFRIDLSEFGIGTGRVVFSQDARGRTTRVHSDLHPLSLEKQPAIKNPRWWITGALGAVAVATTATAVGRARNQARKGRKYERDDEARRNLGSCRARV